MDHYRNCSPKTFHPIFITSVIESRCGQMSWVHWNCIWKIRKCFETIGFSKHVTGRDVHSALSRWVSISANHNLKSKMHWKKKSSSVTALLLVRAGLTIEQTGQMPGASHFWGLRAWMSKHSFTGFSCC